MYCPFFAGLLSRFIALTCLFWLVALSVPISNYGPTVLRALRTSYVTSVACLFRLMALRTSYVMCVACLFRLMALRTSYVICVPCLFRLIVLRTRYVICVACFLRLSDSCYMLSVPVSTLGLRTSQCYKCSFLVLTHGTTRLQEIPSESGVSTGSDGLHGTTFQLSLKYCLHFRFHLTTRLPVTQVDWTVLPVSFFD